MQPDTALWEERGCSEWESALRNLGKGCTVWGQRDEKILKIPENNLCESNHWFSSCLSWQWLQERLLKDSR